MTIDYRQAPEAVFPAAGEVSAAVNAHRLLARAGVDADLNVWDGLDHGFFANGNLPESGEALDVATRFFERHLAGR